MTWMLTSSGALLNLRFIADDAIRVEDIAHHLAQINRFTGACARPYSVAEHSLLVVQIMEHMGISNPHALLAGLMHDAHEAYTTDLSTPMKDAVGAAWHAVENQVKHAVRRKFALLVASQVAAHGIEIADLTALSTERAQLMPPDGPEWPCTRMHPPVPWVRLSDRLHMTWQDWRQAFLDKHAELEDARREDLHDA